MIPQTVLALVAFLFLVAPGLLFELLRERRRPARNETSFREGSRTALASLLITLGALLLLAAVDSWRAPTLVPDITAWIRDPQSYAVAATSQIIRFLLIELIVALAIALAIDQVTARRMKGKILPFGMAWWSVLQQEAPGARPFVRVRLSDGSEYSGTVTLYDLDPSPANRDLVLGAPLTWQAADASEPSRIDEEWQRLCIPGAMIQTLLVQYIPERDAQRFLTGGAVDALPAQHKPAQDEGKSLVETQKPSK
jgi:Family of unknown function (DUF6338)